jgi:hypothetical protein
VNIIRQLLDVRIPAVTMFLPLFYVPSHERKLLVATDIKDKRNYKLDHLHHILHKFIRIALVIGRLYKRVRNPYILHCLLKFR